tara:strand:+ start:178 stop:1116 length:939 start_codon:yes stop_codon:yes gene_type:complete
MYKNIFISIALILFFSNNAVSTKVEIISKVNEEVITNLDIDYEIKYLKFLNPKLDDLNNQNALIQLAKKSIIREIIKKKELINYINLNEEHLDVIKQIEIDLINKKNLNNKNELKKIVLSKDLNYNKLFQKLKIEAMWNELIFQKYINNVKIDETKLKKQVQKFKNEYSFSYDYSLSEILFEIEKDQTFENRLDEIKESIEKIGFDNTANIYSVSDSSKFGGKVGWVNESQISEVISNNIKNLKINELSKVLKSPAGYLILKINDKKKINEPFDEKKYFNMLKQAKTNQQLNQFSIVFFKRLKQNTFINEYK